MPRVQTSRGERRLVALQSALEQGRALRPLPAGHVQSQQKLPSQPKLTRQRRRLLRDLVCCAENVLCARDERVRVGFLGLEGDRSQRRLELRRQRAHRLGRWLTSRSERNSLDRERRSETQ